KATSNFSALLLTTLPSIRFLLKPAHIAIAITSLAIPFWWNIALHYSARGTPMCVGAKELFKEADTVSFRHAAPLLPRVNFRGGGDHIARGFLRLIGNFWCCRSGST